jgi:hypothetical protein
MVKTIGVLLALASAVASATAAPRAYVFRAVASIEIVEPGGRTSLEDKAYLDCDDFKVTDSDVKFALRGSRAVSPREWSDRIASVGCYVGVRVTFDNGERAYVAIEPTGRVLATPEPARYGGRSYYFRCRACVSRAWGIAR